MTSLIAAIKFVVLIHCCCKFPNPVCSTSMLKDISINPPTTTANTTELYFETEIELRTIEISTETTIKTTTETTTESTIQTATETTFETSTGSYPWTTTESFQNDCPENFKQHEDICYLLEDTYCPYYAPLPYKFTSGFIFATVENILLNISRKATYGYYQWQEIGYKHGTLFSEILLTVGEYISANEHNYIATSSKYPLVCAYNRTNSNGTFCRRYDQICKNNTDKYTENCHCLYKNEHFCENECGAIEPIDNSWCDNCAIIASQYGEPQIDLKFDESQTLIFITIKSHLKLIVVNGDLPIYCFTDAATDVYDVIYKYNFTKDTIDLYQENYKTLQYVIKPQPNTIGHYWCEGFDFNMKRIQSEKIIATNFDLYESKPSLTLNFTVTRSGSYAVAPLRIHKLLQGYLNDIIDDSEERQEWNTRFLNIYPENGDLEIKISFRIYVNEENMTKNVATIKTIFNETIEVSPSFCLSEQTIINNKELTWPETSIGATTLPEELCLQNDGTPVTRTCLGEYLYGAYWSDVKGYCDENSEQHGSSKTETLYDLVNSAIATGMKLNKLKDLLDEEMDDSYAPIDAHFIADIANKIAVSTDRFNMTKLIDIGSTLMEFESNTLKNAQKLLNTTDFLLYTIDLALNSETSNTIISEEGVYEIKTKNLYIQVSSIFVSGVIGAAFYGSDDLQVKRLKYPIKIDEIDRDNLKLATFIPETQQNKLRETAKFGTKLIIVLFKTNSLFNEPRETANTGYVIGMYLTDFIQTVLDDPIPVLIKPSRRYRGTVNCSHWNYGVDKLWVNKKGSWASDDYASKNDDFYLCYYDHMTHFAILVDVEETLSLSIITGIGCALSTLGAVGVVVTAIAYKTWREKSGTKILLNFVAVLILQNIVIFLGGGIDTYRQEPLCIMTGSVLHYLVLTQFAWMLVIGYLQYQRYVKVFVSEDRNLIIKSCVVAWGLPIIPIIIVLCLSKESYVQENYCYLTGTVLYLAVFLPALPVIIINLFMFALILLSLRNNKRQSFNKNDNLTRLHLRLIILLYFLLGFYWIFGILAGLTRSTVLAYCFCFSAGLQGIVIYLYYIVFNHLNRSFWTRSIKQLTAIRRMEKCLKKNTNKIKVQNNKKSFSTTNEDSFSTSTK